MYRACFLFCFLFILKIGFTQESIVLSDTISENHIPISGTHLYLDNSETYLEASAQNPKLLIDMQSQAFLFSEEYEQSLVEYLETLPAKLRLRDTLLERDLVLEGFSGKLYKGITGRGEASEIFWFLYIGKEDFVIDVKGGYPKHLDNQLGDQILKILSSAVIIPDPQGPYDELPFFCNSEALFYKKGTSLLPNSIVLKKETDTLEASVTIFYSIIEDSAAAQIKNESEPEFKEEIMVDGAEGFQSWSKVDDGKETLIFEASLKKSNREIGFIGSGPYNAELLEEFKSMVQSLDFK
jgi:hypothetical protein